MSGNIELKREIETLNAAAMEAFRRKDAEQIAAGFTVDGRFLAPNAPIAVGRAAIAAHWRLMMALPNVTARWGSTYVEAARSGELAYELGTYDLAFDADGGRFEDQGKYVVVWRKEEGAWKIAADAITSDKPIAG
jgi:uncharacterized protein (TIGR02246 family)